ncbi:(2Fe-2S)-binding protein [Paenibacillus beijingensis]|uniref:(2Fe-2S)-binding protein n=1 Tax=Paenibacillus beijingensis TaxID=1126833 RepID=A0A0D5NEU1_9BACL|nr:(2Fe-2S)-binding protein [Paenibacillus beijingensis]AJY73497.1 (2Fe-2S)-binding protein [Paenibacillus beijingensis]
MSELTRNIVLNVNGTKQEITVPVRYTLADGLREVLDLTGTHLGCEHGFCGACTVLVDGRSVRSCLMLAVQADGCSVLTIEGLANADGSLSPLQQAFHEQHGLQCGFCTPGFLMTATELFSGNSNPTEEEIKEALSGNICRCTGYQGILEAMKQAALQSSGG